MPAKYQLNTQLNTQLNKRQIQTPDPNSDKKSDIYLADFLFSQEKKRVSGYECPQVGLRMLSA